MNKNSPAGICITRQQLFIAAAMLCITLFRLWLSDAYTLRAFAAPHDDLHFVTLASHLLNGDWLGEYNQFTLIKGVFYPVWIAFCNLAGIPLLAAQQILYASACLLFIVAVNPYIRNKWWLVVIYSFLLFNPFSMIVDRVFRLGIYPALTIFVITCAFALYSRTVSDFGKPLLWSLGLGITLAAFWHTREEAIWILPTLLVFYIIIGLQAIFSRKHELTKIVALFSLPVLILAASTLTISTLNWSKYGVFKPLEIQSSEFESAYSGLLKIKTNHWLRFYPVLEEAREKAYQASPAFRELKPYMEEIGDSWKGDRPDIPAAYFIWVFRDAVFEAGYYNYKDSENPKNNIRNTYEFYQRMGNELQAACDKGTLECSYQISSLIQPWRKEFTALLFPTFYQTLSTLVSFEGLDYKHARLLSVGSHKNMVLFETVTNERLRSSRRDNMKIEPEFYQQHIESKIKIIRNIWRNFYHHPVPWMFALFTIFLLFKAIYELLKLKPHPITVLGLSALAGILSNTAILTLVQITSYTRIDRAMSPGYPLVIILIICGFLILSSASDSFSKTKQVV